MTLINKIRYIHFNAIFWIVYFLYEWIGHGSVTDEYLRYFINASVMVSTAFLASYLTVNVFFRKYYLQNKKTKFWAGQILMTVVVVLARRAFMYHYTYHLYYPEYLNSTSFLFLPKLIIELVNLYLVVSLYAMIYFMRSWYEQQQSIQTLRQEKTSAELELLKSQVHPHFIFNTLNNIYSVALQKSPESACLILRLSSFLDYNLYDSQNEKVPLKTEIDYVKNFIALEQLRFGEKLDVSFNIYNPMEGLHIAPLLLLPLVENCFKHGVASSISDSWIRIDVSRKDTSFTIKIENSKEPHERKNENKNCGLGLNNVCKRLELIYPGQHDLKILNETNSFLIILKIMYDQ